MCNKEVIAILDAVSKSFKPTYKVERVLKKIINNKKSEFLHLANVHPKKCCFFLQNKQGKLKTNNFSFHDIVVKINGLTEKKVYVFDNNGHIKPIVIK